MNLTPAVVLVSKSDMKAIKKPEKIIAGMNIDYNCQVIDQ